jgi:hypothetical protein
MLDPNIVLNPGAYDRFKYYEANPDGDYDQWLFEQQHPGTARAAKVAGGGLAILLILFRIAVGLAIVGGVLYLWLHH